LDPPPRPARRLAGHRHRPRPHPHLPARPALRPLRHVLPGRNVRWIEHAVTGVDHEGKSITLAGGEELSYDVLIIATGTRTVPEALDGLTDASVWKRKAFDFYTMEGAIGLRDKLRSFSGGRVVVNFAEMPIKCPVAPMEMAFLLEAWCTEQGIRDDVELQFVTPLDGAFTKPVAAATIGSLLDSRGIEVVPDFAAQKVDGDALVAWDGRRMDFDILIETPPHRGSQLFDGHALADELAFIRVDKHTLQSVVHDDVFALGDATDCPTSKAGSVAHFQGEALLDNIVRHISGRPVQPTFDGHANCFVETGHEKALLLDFNYTTQPLPGQFPMAGMGPFTLLGETRINHYGKLAFRWIYWNLLLNGRGMPVDARMLMAGKRGAA
jgi:sulfide:quinone oxidoreductase